MPDIPEPVKPPSVQDEALVELHERVDACPGLIDFG